MKRIEAYTGIRFFWAISIIVCHLYWIYDALCFKGNCFFLRHGSYAVSGFFVLSGFLVRMHYGSKFSQNASKSIIKQGIAFLIKHVKKWYILYVISMVPFVCNLCLGCESVKDIVKLLGKVCTNLVLVQVWLPFHDYSINGVSWFLSCICAIYVVTPILLMINAKIEDNKIISFGVAICCILAVYLMQDRYGVLYHHPFFRIFQFVLGVMLYNMLRDIEWKCPRVLGIIAVILQIVAYVKIVPVVTNVVDTLAVVVFIVVFFFDTRSVLLSNKVIVRLGGLSTELFLLHYSIVNLLGPYLIDYLPKQDIYLWGEQIILCLLSVLVAWFYHNWFQNIPIIKTLNRKLQNIMT